jgi:hypothetical protein
MKNKGNEKLGNVYKGMWNGDRTEMGETWRWKMVDRKEEAEGQKNWRRNI